MARPQKYKKTAHLSGTIEGVKRDLLRALGYSDGMVYEKGADSILQASFTSQGGMRSTFLIKLKESNDQQIKELQDRNRAIDKALEGIKAQDIKEEKNLSKFRKAFSKVIGDNGTIDYLYRKTPQFDRDYIYYNLFEDKAKDIAVIAKIPVTPEMVIDEITTRWKEKEGIGDGKAKEAST